MHLLADCAKVGRIVCAVLRLRDISGLSVTTGGRTTQKILRYRLDAVRAHILLDTAINRVPSSREIDLLTEFGLQN